MTSVSNSRQKAPRVLLWWNGMKFRSFQQRYAIYRKGFSNSFFVSVASLVLFLESFASVATLDSRNVVFTIVSQPEPYLTSVARRLKQDIHNQILEIEQRLPTVHLSHEDFPVLGAWTITPLFELLTSQHMDSDVRWHVFLEPHTAVSCRRLLETLDMHDKQMETMWIGYPLTDDEPTIIHHFATYGALEDEGGLMYPNFASGFAMRTKLINKVLHIETDDPFISDDEFSIDPSFELAQLLYGNGTHPGALLTPDLNFCIVSGENCATYPRQFETCGSAIPEDSIFFAVKTWSGFHDTRAKTVRKTWGQHVTHLQFYSDVYDSNLNAINVGVPNAKSGHCVKTMTILKKALETVKTMPQVKWIFLADDDTILGVHKLCEVLSCYRGGEAVTVLGDKYGYGHRRKGGKRSYDYITGGGGTAFSVGAVKALSHCTCFSITAPDDLSLGMCAMDSNIHLTHSPLFHQALPSSYPRELLARDRPVSFHGAWPTQHRVYTTWFQRDDRTLPLKRSRDDL